MQQHFWGEFSHPGWAKPCCLSSASATLQITASASHAGHRVVRPPVIQGKQQPVILCKQIIKWQVMLNGDKCGFPIFFSLQS